MDAPAIFQQLRERFGPAISGGKLDAADPWVEVLPESLEEVARYLRDEQALRMNFLHCVTGVDYFEPDAKKAAKVPWQPHLEVLYHLSSTVHRHRLLVKVMLPRWKDGACGADSPVADAERNLEHGQLARAGGVRSDGRRIPGPSGFAAASSVRKTGWVTRCGKITRCRWNTTGFGDGRRQKLGVRS